MLVCQRLLKASPRGTHYRSGVQSAHTARVHAGASIGEPGRLVQR